MAQPSELLAEELQPSLSADPPDLFSEIGEFFKFIWEELKPFPGRGHTVVRLVICAVVTVLISETLRIPNPSFSAYLIFFIANEDGVSSVKMGLATMAGLTVAIILAMGINICFLDAPWFRLPATFLLIAGTVWLSRTLVLAAVGRMIAVIFALYLSLADATSNAETQTESTLWLWSIVGVAVVVSVLTSLLLEPRPDLLLRALTGTSLKSVQHLLESLLTGHTDRLAQARALRRELYATPPRMRQLLGRWRQRSWLTPPQNVDWDLSIFLVERLLSIAAALAAAPGFVTDERTRHAIVRLGETVGELRQAVLDRNREAVQFLTVPTMDGLPHSVGNAALVELAAVLSDFRLVPVPWDEPHEIPTSEKAAEAKQGLLIPDAWTNPEYSHFALKTTLAIIACELFLNAVNWPGIRTCMITCIVTAMATVGAQRQRQLMRLTGTGVGGLMGLGAVLFLIPHLDSIVELLLLVAAGTAVCAWVGAGSVRTSYAGFQMALAFFIMLLPGFDTSIDLTSIRDRFVGILVGITAMWIFFDHLWPTSSRRQLVDKWISLLHLMTKAPKMITPALSPDDARKQAISFRRELYGELSTGRLFLDETRIELSLNLNPKTVHGTQLEILATEMTFAAFLLLALNEKKLRALASGHLPSLQPTLQPADEALAQNLNELANSFHPFRETAFQPNPVGVLTQLNLNLTRLQDTDPIGLELGSVYEALQVSVKRIFELNWMVRALP